MLQPGDVFDGKYKVVRLLGKGGMSSVFLAEHVSLGNFWAVKQVTKQEDSEVDLLAEPNILKRLSHPALPRIVDIFEDEQYIYIVEDYIEGQDLEKGLQSKGKFPEGQVVNWALQLCDALRYLHSQTPHPIIYRDTKPGNIIVSKDNRVKLIDFGIAREYKHDTPSDTTHIGTRGYAAPEQYGGKTDARTDIFNLGVTLYHLVSGQSPNQPPYEFSNVRNIDPSLSKGIEYIIRKCTQQNPDKRYQSIQELERDLENIHIFDAGFKKYTVKRTIATFVLVALFFGFAGLTYYGWMEMEREKNIAYDEFLNTGMQYAQQFHHDEAVEAFAAAKEIIPGRVEAYKETARLYIAQHRWVEALNYISVTINTVTVAIDDPDFYCLMGTAYFNLEDYGNAADNFRHSRQLAPDNVRYYRDEAVSLARSGDLNAAKAALEEIKEGHLHQEDIILYLQGEISRAEGEFAKAVGYFESVLQSTDQEELKERAYLSIAEIYRDHSTAFSDAFNLQVDILERALRDLQDQFNVVVIEMLGQAYYNRGLAAPTDSQQFKDNMQQAASQFQLLINRGYRFPYLYRNMGVIYHYLGDFEKSESFLLEMQALYPENHRSYMELALLYANMENQKPNVDRDYTRVVEHIELAIRYSSSGKDNPELRPLLNMLEDLREGGWLD